MKHNPWRAFALGLTNFRYHLYVIIIGAILSWLGHWPDWWFFTYWAIGVVGLAGVDAIRCLHEKLKGEEED